MKKTIKPIFFIGVPRSGTTIMYELFSQHISLAWLSNFSGKFPKQVWINKFIYFVDNRYLKLRGKKKQHNKIHILNKILPKPDECYNFWNFYTNVNFSGDYLLNKTATDEEVYSVNKVISEIVNYRHKERFCAKLTGPGRIKYLNSIFPDAIFIHVIRDGRSVVNSLMNVDFWQKKRNSPAWENGLSTDDLTIWNKNSKNAYLLAALQWKKIIYTTREEGKLLNNNEKRYMEIKYEDFISNPKETLNNIYNFCDLVSFSEKIDKSLENENLHSSFNNKYLKNWDDETVGLVNDALYEDLKDLKYEI